jgi:hypothetical protein
MADLFAIVDAGFLNAEEELRRPTLWCHPLPDGGEAVVAGDRLSVAASGDAYVYDTPMAAVLAAARWIEASCAGEPEGWTRHPATGRTRFDGARRDAETAWVCPRHPDRLPRFERGRLFCVGCGRVLVDAIPVRWPPRPGAP